MLLVPSSIVEKTSEPLVGKHTHIIRSVSFLNQKSVEKSPFPPVWLKIMPLKR